MARDYRPKSSRLAIDANVLSLLLVYNHCVCTNISVQRRERILVETRGRDDGLPTERFNDLWEVFCSVTRRMVTQHIIAETLNCRRGWLRDNRRRPGEAPSRLCRSSPWRSGNAASWTSPRTRPISRR